MVRPIVDEQAVRLAGRFVQPSCLDEMDNQLVRIARPVDGVRDDRVGESANCAGRSILPHEVPQQCQEPKRVSAGDTKSGRKRVSLRMV